MADMHQALLQDVEAKVAEKVEELWKEGKKLLNQVQQKHQERADKLTADISRCVERQRALETENEQLKQVIADMEMRLAAVLAALGPEAASAHSAGGCPTSSPAASSGSPIASPAMLESPPPPSGPDPTGSRTPLHGGSSGSTATLGEVPPFPSFSAPTTPATSPSQVAAPLLLAEALGTRSPERVQESGRTPTLLSLATSLPQVPPMEAAFPAAVSSPVVFSFTIRRADETDLGLNVSHQERDQVLYVEGIRADGAVDAWNRQCVGGAYPEKAVVPGDLIVSVNNVAYDPEAMLAECKDQRLLRLTIARGGLPPLDLPIQAPAASTTAGGASAAAAPATALRADASEFVPRAIGATVADIHPAA